MRLLTKIELILLGLAMVVATAGVTTVFSVFARPAENPVPVAVPAAAPAPRTPYPTVSSSVAVVTTLRPTRARSAPRADAPVTSVLRTGVLLPVAGSAPGFVRILTPCELGGWVSLSDVRLHQRAAGPTQRLNGATIVLDAGHGGFLRGATGPTGYREKDANLDIVRRAAAHLRGARVFFTRRADYAAGLRYRMAIANALRADAFVSVHHNALPRGPSAKPGTEIFYQHLSARSKRIAGLIYEEVFHMLRAYRVRWVANRDAGATYRLNSRGTDYYALLRGSKQPTALVEGLFISNRPEEHLLRQPEFRELLARAIARGITRYFETDDPGSGYSKPLPRPSGPSGRLPSRCVDPV